MTAWGNSWKTSWKTSWGQLVVAIGKHLALRLTSRIRETLTLSSRVK